MHILLLIAALTIPTITWETFYATIGATGVRYSDPMRALEGKRVQIRGYAVEHPRLQGGLFLTRFGHNDPHGVEEHDLPFDATAVIWRKGIAVPPVPKRPTIEGVLRLGNRSFGPDQVVTMTLEDAVPVIRAKTSPQ